MLAALLIAVYAAASLGLLVYGINCYGLVALFLRRRRQQAAASAEAILAAGPCFEPSRQLPLVATQIPLDNEANVAERVLRAAAAIDYPRDRHEIQVLDDSDDDPREIVDRVAAELRGGGHRVTVIRRADRAGFKADTLTEDLDLSYRAQLAGWRTHYIAELEAPGELPTTPFIR